MQLQLDLHGVLLRVEEPSHPFATLRLAPTPVDRTPGPRPLGPGPDRPSPHRVDLQIDRQPHQVFERGQPRQPRALARPEGLPAALVGVETLRERGVEIAAKLGCHGVGIVDDGMIVGVHRHVHDDPHPVLLGRPGQAVLEDAVRSHLAIQATGPNGSEHRGDGDRDGDGDGHGDGGPARTWAVASVWRSWSWWADVHRLTQGSPLSRAERSRARNVDAAPL